MLLEHWQKNRVTRRVLLKEIGQLVVPYTRDFIFKQDSGFIKTNFEDDQSNEIVIMFHQHWGSKVPRYEIEFSVNGFSVQSFKTSIKHFFKIISTVIYCINLFIDKYNPESLLIDGLDKYESPGQKNKIWIEYAKMNIKDRGYKIGHIKNGFEIRKK